MRLLTCCRYWAIRWQALQGPQVHTERSCSLHPESRHTQHRHTSHPRSIPIRSKGRSRSRLQLRSTLMRQPSTIHVRMAPLLDPMVNFPLLQQPTTEKTHAEHQTPVTVRHGVHSIHRTIQKYLIPVQGSIDPPATTRLPSKRQHHRSSNQLSRA